MKHTVDPPAQAGNRKKKDAKSKRSTRPAKDGPATRPMIGHRVESAASTCSRVEPFVCAVMHPREHWPRLAPCPVLTFEGKTIAVDTLPAREAFAELVGEPDPSRWDDDMRIAVAVAQHLVRVRRMGTELDRRLIREFHAKLYTDPDRRISVVKAIENAVVELRFERPDADTARASLARLIDGHERLDAWDRTQVFVAAPGDAQLKPPYSSWPVSEACAVFYLMRELRDIDPLFGDLHPSVVHRELRRHTERTNTTGRGSVSAHHVAGVFAVAVGAFSEKTRDGESLAQSHERAGRNFLKAINDRSGAGPKTLLTR